MIIFRRIQHILVKPVTDWGYLQLNSSAPLPDSLLINIKTPPDPEIVGSSHKEQQDEERPPKKLYFYEFGGVFTGNSDSTLEETATFNPEIFFYVLLPPIIFHAGYRQDFLRKL